MIRGLLVDQHGRCEHYHSELDVVANKCSVCGDYWACHLCHAAESAHPFGQIPLDEPAIECGVCGHRMSYQEYGPRCPACEAQFNPGCSLHAGIYFAIPR
ncbi:CHY zinc finger protein [Corynebacterium sp. H128]|uniref:CHY zinc finger protein n=1 Tax=Corynebacterium sp. H128 TaxID=3133427 RepID=UPI0030A17AA6